MSKKLVDPIGLLVEKASAHNPHPATSLSGVVVVDELPYEVPFVPPAGTVVKRITVGSTYRTPIPVLYDPATRTTFPLPNTN